MRTVVVLGQDEMGKGDKEIGQRILATFLQKAATIKGLTAVLLYNTGVHLAAEGSPVLTELRLMYESGVDIAPCGTCVDYFGLREKIAVGEISNMDAIIDELNQAEKVITL